MGIRAVQEMIEKIDLFNLDLVASDRPTIRFGFSLTIGQGSAGYTGTQPLAIYTCVGDIFDLAVRLKAYPKVDCWLILIDECPH